MPEIHYRDRFLQAELGPVVVRLARRVRQSVTLTVAGRPVALDRVRELEANTYALPEHDLQDFLKSVGEIGGYQDDQSYRSLSLLFTPDNGEDSSNAQDPDTLASEPGSPQTEAHEASDVDAATPADTVAVDVSITASEATQEEQTPSPASSEAKVQKRRNKAPKVHPDVPGLRLQADGYYWNPKWGDV